MADLQFVAFSDDGKVIILQTPTGEWIEVPIAGEHAAAAHAREVEPAPLTSDLTPREIQARIRAGETPEALHRELLALETAAGRPTIDARAKNAPRPLDLDLLAYGTEQRSDPTLTIPHPRCHERRFVLEPWAALAPEFEIPGRGTVSELLQALPRG